MCAPRSCPSSAIRLREVFAATPSSCSIARETFSLPSARKGLLFRQHPLPFRFETLIDGKRFELLAARVSADSRRAEVRAAYARPDWGGQKLQIRARKPGARRRSWHQRMTFENHAAVPRGITLSDSCSADFMTCSRCAESARERHGTLFPPLSQDDGVKFSYAGLDDLHAVDHREREPSGPTTAAGGRLTFNLTIPARGSLPVEFVVTGRLGHARGEPARFEDRTARCLHCGMRKPAQSRAAASVSTHG
jgi:hypothetical protein